MPAGCYGICRCENLGESEHELELQVRSKMAAFRTEDGRKHWQCGECAYTCRNSNDMRKHIERKHLGVLQKYARSVKIFQYCRVVDQSYFLADLKILKQFESGKLVQIP